MIYDCITFNNEPDILEIRFNTMNSFVDKFVITEGNKTFQGDNKPYYFDRYRDRFIRFAHKIITNKVDLNDLELQEQDESKKAWTYETIQRNSVLGFLEKDMYCGDYDVIIISDVDEIIDPNVFVRDPETPVYYNMRQVYFFLNVLMGDLIFGPISFKYKNRNKYPNNATIMRYCVGWNHTMEFQHVSYGGWHLSYMGGYDTYFKKLSEFSHVELNTDSNKTRERYNQMFNDKFDLIGRSMRIIPLNRKGCLPEYVINNLEKYHKKGWIYEEGIN